MYTDPNDIIIEKDNEIGYLTQALADVEALLKFRKEQWDLADERLAEALIKIENLEDLYSRKHDRVEEQSKEIVMLKVLRDHAPTFDALARQEFTEKFEAESAELLRQLEFAHKQIEDYKLAVIELHDNLTITNDWCNSWADKTRKQKLMIEALRSQRDAQITDDPVLSARGFIGRDLFIKELDEDLENI